MGTVQELGFAHSPFRATPGLLRRGKLPWIKSAMNRVKPRLIPCLFGLALMLTCGGAAEQTKPDLPPWKDGRTTSDGVTISSRRLPGTGLYEVRASCVAAAPPATVFAVSMKRETYQDTTKYMVVYRILEDGERAWCTYERLRFPFLKDRDYTVRHELVVNEPGKRYVVRWANANDRGPKPEPGVIRVSISDGELEITPAPDGTGTRIVCTAVANPGGWVPHWVANFVNRSTVPDLIRVLRSKSIQAAQAGAQ